MTIEGLVRGSRAAARGAFAAWLVALVLALAGGHRHVDAGALVLLLGTASLLPLACFLLGGILVALVRPAHETPFRPAPRAVALVLAGELALWCALVWIASGPLAALVPTRFAYRALIARVALAHVAVALAAGACWLVWRRSKAGGWFPLWTLCVLHLVARLYTRQDIALVWPGHDLMLDAATSAFCVLSAARWRDPSPPRRELLRVLPAMIAAQLLAFTAAVARPSALSALIEDYPGPGAAVVQLRAYYDLDGDGFASMLGGLDCDDADVRVGPMALEIVGNGVDDNCMGGDLPSYPSSLPPVTRASPPIAHNLVLIVIDSLRGDALARGRTPAPMPQVAAFGRKAALFERAYAHAPYTGQAMRAMLTGQYPMNMNAFEHSLGMEPTIAVALRAAGYQTSAIVQFDEFDKRSHAVSGKSTILAGFSRVDWDMRTQNVEFRGVTSTETTQRALAELERLRAGGRPFFLLVHYFDPHAEYMPRAGTPFSADTAEGPYWQEVFATDRDVGKLLDRLEQIGYYDDGYVALTADHGELLGEHGHFLHSYWLDEEALHVPLLVRGPDVVAGRFAARVRQIDIAPTLLDRAAGIHPPLPGRNLADVWSGRDRRDRDVVAVTTYERRVIKRTIMRGAYKLDVDVMAGNRILSRSGTRPAERRNVIDEQPEVASELERALGQTWDASMNDRIIARRAEAAHAQRRTQPAP